jgi:hypothetical protein
VVRNETDRELTVDISGPVSTSLLLYPDGEASQIVPEGHTTTGYWKIIAAIFGQLNSTNPDKHELLVRENKAVLWIPRLELVFKLKSAACLGRMRRI